jgi:large repetitive protein
LGSIISQYNFNFNLPNTIPAGTYKYKVTSTSPAITSPISTETLTVLSTAAGAGPNLTASATTFSSLGGTYITFTASGCSGTVYWQQSGNDAATGVTYGTNLYQTTIITAYCKDPAGCASMPSQITTTYNCTDILEPNNTAPTATPITVNTYTSPTICLDGYTNDDWFTWNYNGKIYYIKASLGSINADAGSYQFKLTQTGSSLVLETLPITSGQYLYTYLRLFDSDGTTLIMSNNGGNGNGFSKITYTLPNPCPATLVLVSPTNDIAAGQTSTLKGSAITATNKVANTAVVDYRGQNTITLNPGFETQISSGGTFKAQVKGCSDTSN